MSGGLLLAFRQRRSNSQGWTQQELAEFYRVESALIQAGLLVSTDHGISDEGDPWFVFCRADTEEVIAHFARIDGEYLISSNLVQGTRRGRDFRMLVRGLIDSDPMLLPTRRRQGQRVLIHPAALLTALVASAYILSSEKPSFGNNSDSTDGHGKSGFFADLLTQKFSILAAAAFAATWIDTHSHSLLQLFENSFPFHFNAVSSEKAAHFSTAQEFAALDAVLRAAHDVELGGHRTASSADGSLPTPASHGPHDQTPAPLQSSLSAAFNPVTDGKGVDSDSGKPPSAPGSPNQVADGSNTENAFAAAFHSALIPGSGSGPEVMAQSVGGQGVQGSELTISSQALHLVSSEISDFASETVILSNGQVPLNQALTQAFQQVGFDPDVIHSLIGSASDMTSHNPAIGSSTSLNVASTTGMEAASGAAPNTSLTNVSSSQQGNSAQQLGMTTVVNVSSSAEMQVTHSVEAFLEHTSSVEISVSGSNVVIIDTNLADIKMPGYSVTTWDLSDGSTLSIVGIIPTNSHVLAA